MPLLAEQSLVMVTRPTGSIELADMARWLSLNTSEEDADVLDMIGSAEETVGNFGIALGLGTWRYTLDRFPPVIDPPLAPLVSVTGITYVDSAGVTQTLAASVYDVFTDSRPGRIMPKYGQTWPSAREQAEAVKVTFTAGHADITTAPQRARQALRIIVRSWYDNPAAGMDVPEAARNLLWQCWSGQVR